MVDMKVAHLAGWMVALMVTVLAVPWVDKLVDEMADMMALSKVAEKEKMMVVWKAGLKADLWAEPMAAKKAERWVVC